MDIFTAVMKEADRLAKDLPGTFVKLTPNKYLIAGDRVYGVLPCSYTEAHAVIKKKQGAVGRLYKSPVVLVQWLCNKPYDTVIKELEAQKVLDEGDPGTADPFLSLFREADGKVKAAHKNFLEGNPPLSKVVRKETQCGCSEMGFDLLRMYTESFKNTPESEFGEMVKKLLQEQYPAATVLSVPVEDWAKLKEKLATEDHLCSKIEISQETAGAANYGQAPTEVALRHNEGKPRLFFLHTAPHAVEGAARVMAFGAEKYDLHNWKKGLKYTAQADSLLRHLEAFLNGEAIDKDSGLPHVDHVLVNALFLAETTRIRPEMDDRGV